jgi:hypothetical protein
LLYYCVQTRGFCSATSAIGRASSVTFERPWENFSTQLWTAKTLPTVNNKHFLMNIPYIVTFGPKQTHNITLLFGSTCLKHGRHFGYWNERVCYLDFHESGLCCYLLIHMDNQFTESPRNIVCEYQTWLLIVGEEQTPRALGQGARENISTESDGSSSRLEKIHNAQLRNLYAL